jgi:hypothetical protein
VLQAEQHAEHIGVERRCIAFGGLLRDRAGLAFGAGVVDGDVETAEARDCLVDEITDIVLVADVGADEFGLRAKRAQLLGQRLSGFVAAAGDDDTGAVSGVGDGGGAADAGEGAGDQDDGIARGGISHGIFLRVSGKSERLEAPADGQGHRRDAQHDQ